jgi:hypothetical protein
MLGSAILIREHADRRGRNSQRMKTAQLTFPGPATLETCLGDFALTDTENYLRARGTAAVSDLFSGTDRQES